MHLALATNTMPSSWEHESAETIATAVEILKDRAEKGARRGR